MRREFLTGFYGSAGEAIVTIDKAILWTDGRYYVQANHQLDCNWILMKRGEHDVRKLLLIQIFSLSHIKQNLYSIKFTCLSS